MTLLRLGIGLVRMASTSQVRSGSKPQVAVRKALTCSLVGVDAVKFLGSGLGKTGAALGAGADGAAAGAAWLSGGAAGTCCCAATGKAVADRASRAVAVSNPPPARRPI